MLGALVPILILAPKHPTTRTPGHPDTYTHRYPGIQVPQALCHLLTGSHGVGPNGTQGFDVSVIDESLTIQGSYSIVIDF